MGPHSHLGSTLQAAPWAHPGLLAECLDSCMGPYNIFSSTPQVAPWAHPGVLEVSFKQMCGPIQKPQ